MRRMNIKIIDSTDHGRSFRTEYTRFIYEKLVYTLKIIIGFYRHCVFSVDCNVISKSTLTITFTFTFTFENVSLQTAHTSTYNNTHTVRQFCKFYDDLRVIYSQRLFANRTNSIPMA